MLGCYNERDTNQHRKSLAQLEADDDAAMRKSSSIKAKR
jgi:hypothetical protein